MLKFLDPIAYENEQLNWEKKFMIYRLTYKYKVKILIQLQSPSRHFVGLVKQLCVVVTI